MIHYGLYTVGIVIMLPALYWMLAAGHPEIEPVVATGSLIVAAAVLVFGFVVFSSSETVRSVSPAAAR
jgi:hypothetical protein